VKVLQWTITIPAGRQEAFETWFEEKGSEGFEKFGALKHELYRERGKNKYVERLFFVDSFDTKDFFAKVKADPKAWQLSRMYEGEFEAKDVEMKVLEKVS
jgi:hypothetical protein